VDADVVAAVALGEVLARGREEIETRFWSSSRKASGPIFCTR
jgi:hypothetical protein